MRFLECEGREVAMKLAAGGSKVRVHCQNVMKTSSLITRKQIFGPFELRQGLRSNKTMTIISYNYSLFSID